MSTRTLLPFLVIFAACMPKDDDSDTMDDTDVPPAEDLDMTVLRDGFDNIFEMVWAPDGDLWVTERTAGRVTRVSPENGDAWTLLDVPDVLITDGTQDGVLGMALDPDLGKGMDRDFVYLAYSYDADPSTNAQLRNVKIVRYTWDADSDALISPIELIAGMPGSNDHNSGRLLYGPDDHLYYTIGDQGKNQYDNWCLPIEAQRLPTAEEVDAMDWSAYQGKVLRLNVDGSIPDDNPMIGGVRSHIWTYGHRNAQGLVFAADGTLYESEHGPKSDDEVNILEPGGNYGWPNVAGYKDDQAYVYANWSASEDPPCDELVYDDFVIPESVPVMQETEWNDAAFHPPERTFYTVEDDFDFQDPNCAEDELWYLCWPTIAPSSLAVYEGHGNAIQGLEGSLLITSLKYGSLYRVKLEDDEGNTLPGENEPEVLLHTVDRYRRVTVSPDGASLYVATDLSGNALDDDGTPTTVVTHPGAILVLSPKE